MLVGYLLDTNIVSAIIQGNISVKAKFLEVIVVMPIAISAITYFECRRGLLANKSQKKIQAFTDFCQLVDILPVTHPEIVEIASEIYADLRSRGCLIQDADILIAATAIAQNWILISNDSDLSRVQGLRLENWLIR